MELLKVHRAEGGKFGRHEVEKREGGGKGNWGTVGDEM